MGRQLPGMEELVTTRYAILACPECRRLHGHVAGCTVDAAERLARYKRELLEVAGRPDRGGG